MIQTAVANEIHPAKIPVRAGVFPPPCTPVKFQNSQTVRDPTSATKTCCPYNVPCKHLVSQKCLSAGTANTWAGVARFSNPL